MVDGMHRIIDRRPGYGAVLADPPAPELKSPTRNRYFYGKLLDVRHLELEQSYFLEARRRLNRLTVGFGVVCGLEVTAASDGKGLVIAPGVAIDGLGREIVVPAPITVADPAQLTDDCGNPAGAATEAAVTFCLAYHECQTEPVPVLVSDCDVHEGCANGAIRERYMLLVHDGLPDAVPYVDEVRTVCALLGARAEDVYQAASSTHEPPAGHTIKEALFARRSAVRVIPGPDYHPGGHGALPADILGCAPPAETCVVLATVTLPTADHDTVDVDDFSYRRIVLSNDRLLEAMLCLIIALERESQQADKTVEVTTQEGDKKQALVVTVTDADGDPVEGELVEFDVTSDLRSSFQPTARRTGADGTAATAWLLAEPGDHTGVAHIDGGSSADLTATL